MSDVCDIKLITDTFVDSCITDSEEDHHTDSGSEYPSSECIMDDSSCSFDWPNDHDVYMNMEFDIGIDTNEFNAEDFDSCPQPQHTERANELVLELFDDILF